MMSSNYALLNHRVCWRDACDHDRAVNASHDDMCAGIIQGETCDSRTMQLKLIVEAHGSEIIHNDRVFNSASATKQ